LVTAPYRCARCGSGAVVRLDGRTAALMSRPAARSMRLPPCGRSAIEAVTVISMCGGPDAARRLGESLILEEVT
jgi:hypothetical protein